MLQALDVREFPQRGFWEQNRCSTGLDVDSVMFRAAHEFWESFIVDKQQHNSLKVSNNAQGIFVIDTQEISSLPDIC